MSSATVDPVSSVLSGDTAERVKRLELFSRFRVQGVRLGENRSTLTGFSTEFRQHREYVPGDNLKFLDWRVYAKSNRLVIRQQEQHTNADVGLALDTSGSMGFAGESMSKHEFGIRCAGMLAYLMFLQRDTFTYLPFRAGLGQRVPPGSSRRHLGRVFERMVTTSAEGETDFKRSLRGIETRFRRRGLVLVFSDFMDDPQEVAHALGRLRLRGHDVIAFQVYDPLEHELDYVDFTQFRDLEDGSTRGVDPQLLRDAYRKQFEAHQTEMKEACLAHGIAHTLLPVSDDYEAVLGDYVRHRMALMQ